MLVRYSPIVEIGAGTGYWARLVADAGGDILAYDKHPPKLGKADYWAKEVESYYPVHTGGPRMAERHSDRTLFLCWPPNGLPMAARCLDFYRGATLIFVGERSGLTGDDRFHKIVNDEWTSIKQIGIPQWFGIHDRLYVFKRTKEST
jgi:hypothetical protein